MRHHISQLHQIIQQFQTKAVDEFDQALQNRCISHVKNYSVALDGVSKGIENREKAKYTFDDSRYKLSQLIDSKKPVDQIKFKNAQNDLITQTSTYNTISYQCKKDLYELTHARAHNATITGFSDALASFTQKTNEILSQSISVAQAISQVPTYQEKYTESRETVRPPELSQTPQAGFTSGFNPSSFSSPPPAPAPNSISGPKSVPSEFDTEWYYLDKNVQQQGPVNFEQLKNLYKTGIVTASTHVFGGNLTDWQPLSGVRNLFAIINS